MALKTLTALIALITFLPSLTDNSYNEIKTITPSKILK